MTEPLNTEVPKGATEAPTSQATVEAQKAKNANLNEEQLDFVTFICQYHGMYGKLIPVEEAVKTFGFESDEFNELLGNTSVLSALVERGVIKRVASLETVSTKSTEPVGEVKEEPKWLAGTLTPVQLIVANTLLDLVDTRSHKKKLQDLGTSTTQYAAWLKDPVFSQYLRERAEGMLGENQHEAHLALLDKVRMGDMKAIAYYNELVGRYISQPTASQNGNGQPVDFKNLLVKILEIIQDEVNDPDASLRISERFKAMINAQSMAGQMLGEQSQLEKPTIAANRELTPRLKELMQKGEGYE